MTRFPRLQDCVSSCRLVTCAKAAAGKRSGTAGATMGHSSLQWAFAEAAVLLLRNPPAGQQSLARLAHKHGPGQAWPVFAPTLARALYDLCKRDTAFDRHKFFPGSRSGVREPAAALALHGLCLGRRR
jgi:hypothetical protein